VARPNRRGSHLDQTLPGFMISPDNNAAAVAAGERG